MRMSFLKKAAATLLAMGAAVACFAAKRPKYVFLFIGDGTSYSQIQATSYYLGACGGQSEVTDGSLSFTRFPAVGSVSTYDATSFCPDSASTATSIASGYKTYSGVINMDTTYTRKFETIAEKLKRQRGYKIGIVSSVNLNHATPAAFYAHQKSRNSYYEIGAELVESGFDYFAGGGLLKPDGADGKQKNLYDMAREAGYTVVTTQNEAEKLSAADGRAIVIDEHLADSDAMSYAIDAGGGEWKLADYVRKGIELLDNKNGFFMMVEGGKIDWACHANDAATTIRDVMALSDAVAQAVTFYNAHPAETLIVVTGDHETGGLTIGFAGTNYDTFLTYLAGQKISFAKFDSDYIAGYKKNGTPFASVMKDVTECFGLVPPGGKTDAGQIELTDYELQTVADAYARTLSAGPAKQSAMTEREYVLYGTYEPLSVTLTHILNNKSGVSFTSYAHTGLLVPVYAAGCGCAEFAGAYDNTDIYRKMAAVLAVK